MRYSIRFRASPPGARFTRAGTSAERRPGAFIILASVFLIAWGVLVALAVVIASSVILAIVGGVLAFATAVALLIRKRLLSLRNRRWSVRPHETHENEPRGRP